MMYSRWILYFIPNLIVEILSLALTPLVACFITKAERTDRVKRMDNAQVMMWREYLIKPLYWFQTHDNAVDEYWWGLFTESSAISWVRHATQEDYNNSRVLRWLCRVLWMWRNAAYGFGYNLFGAPVDETVSIKEVGSKSSGYWWKHVTRQSSFQIEAHLPVSGSAHINLNFGWKTHRGFPRAMYANRVFSIKRNS